jgi:MFS family permease
MFILCAVQNFGYYGTILWLPSYLSKQSGYSIPQSSLWTAVMVVGMALGIWLFGPLADRRRDLCDRHPGDRISHPQNKRPCPRINTAFRAYTGSENVRILTRTESKDLSFCGY